MQATAISDCISRARIQYLQQHPEADIIKNLSIERDMVGDTMQIVKRRIGILDCFDNAACEQVATDLINFSINLLEEGI